MDQWEKDFFKNLPIQSLNQQFETACQLGYKDKLKFLLTSPELNQNVDIHLDDDIGLVRACQEGNLAIVKYLLTSPDLTTHANIHAKNDLVFTVAYN